MVKRCMKPASNLHKLSWSNWNGTRIIITTHTRVQGASRLKASTLERSLQEPAPSNQDAAAALEELEERSLLVAN